MSKDEARHEVCLHPDRWEYVQASLVRIEAKQDKLNARLFEGNGQPAIIPTHHARISQLEESMVPHDDVVEMVKAFKVGKSVIWAIGIVAAIGMATVAFWHLFQLNKGVQS